MTTGDIRTFASAALIGTATALLFDAVLQNAVNAVRVAGGDPLPWWVVGRVLERGAWVLAAALAWVAAPVLATTSAPPPVPHGRPLSRSAACVLAGRAMVVMPLLWIAASTVAATIRITLLGAWEFDGRVFASAAFYTTLGIGYVPWLAGGVVLMALRRHVRD